jgi:hypothetical protein
MDHKEGVRRIWQQVELGNTELERYSEEFAEFLYDLARLRIRPPQEPEAQRALCEELTRRAWLTSPY